MGSAAVKILLVDDIGENLLALAALLRRDDLEIHSVTSGAAALDLLLEHDFAVAIIDVQMPGMNGFELAEFMRSTERTKRIPIVFVTAGSDEPSHAFKGYESGAVDFLYKPLDSHTVKSKVNIFVEMYLQRGALSQQVIALQQARTEQEKLLKELQKTQQELQQAVRMRDDFMSIVSHELRTPLNTLKLELYTRKHYIETGEFDVFTPERIAQMVETDERQLDRLIRLINDILDVSRIRTGQLSVRPTQVNLSALVTRVVQQFSVQFSSSGCEVRIRAPAAASGYWDEFRIEQALANLLTNAMRHGAGKPIEIIVEELNDEVRLAVCDYGAGIKAEDRTRIFNQFERGTNERKGSGLGLGLFITDQIIRSHGGSISVESEPGQGATFIITLYRKMPGMEAS
ncbi:MAG TPA: hybrid sensor histidine kinase/response regulator [Spongiibacteraceae bacterium]